MNSNRIEEATHELLREAQKSRNQLCKMKNGSGEFVRCRYSYVEPEELRTLYLAAFNSLRLDGKLKKVLENDILEIYEVNGNDNGSGLSIQDAKATLIDGANRFGQLFKIHSPEGEFIQCGSKVYFEPDQDRILYLEALYELLHHGQVQVVSDIGKFTSYQAAMNGDRGH